MADLTFGEPLDVSFAMMTPSGQLATVVLPVVVVVPDAERMEIH